MSAKMGFGFPSVLGWVSHKSLTPSLEDTSRVILSSDRKDPLPVELRAGLVIGCWVGWREKTEL